MGTDSPEIVLVALRVVEAVMIDDRAALSEALGDCRGRALPVLLSLAALASELLQSSPVGPAKLQEWLLASAVEAATDTLGDEPGI